MRDPFDEYDDDYFDSGERLLGEKGCLFPGNCCMAAVMHYTSECYTPEMYEDIEAETRIPEAVAYLISRGSRLRISRGNLQSRISVNIWTELPARWGGSERF
jgi:hypothetical protein